MYWETDVDDIKLLWKVVVNSHKNLLFGKNLKNYLNAILALVLL